MPEADFTGSQFTVLPAFAVFDDGSCQQSPNDKAEVCRELGIKLIDGLGEKVQSSPLPKL